jgi:hypothetical protein
MTEPDIQAGVWLAFGNNITIEYVIDIPNELVTFTFGRPDQKFTPTMTATKDALGTCEFFVREASYQPLSTGTRLLAGTQKLFGQRKTDRLSTSEILTELTTMDEAPWGEINGGKPLDARRLAKELAAYQVRPAGFKSANTTVKGYVTYATPSQVGLADAWSRYLSDLDQDGDRA